jgi:hypothetical protein
MLLLALLHLGFPRRFGWKSEFKSLSLLSAQLMYVHTFFVALVVFLFGMVCLLCAPELVEHTRLARAMALILAIFWGLRCVFQFFVYSPQLWKGKKFETRLHILFSLIWVYFTIVFISLLISV